MRLNLSALALAAAWVVGGASRAGGQHAPRPPGAEYDGKAFTFTRIAEGVYHAIGTGNLAVGANAVVIVNRDDVLLVDSHVSPAAAWALLKELRDITPTPVRYVVNTHFHYDHAHGNQVYGPGVQVIGHEFTRTALLAGKSKQGAAYEGLVRVLRQRQDSLAREAGAARTAPGRTEARKRLAMVRRYQAAIDAVVPVAPTVTLSQSLTLHRGGREIRILFFGRGHTGGDVVVYLPAERVLATGDLVGSGLPFLGDGYPEEWAATLGKLGTLEWDVILPGHGPPVRDREMPSKLAAVLRDFHRQGSELLDQGVPVAEAALRIDLTAHAGNYPALANRQSEDTRERLTIGLWRLKELRDTAR